MLNLRRAGGHQHAGLVGVTAHAERRLLGLHPVLTGLNHKGPGRIVRQFKQRFAFAQRDV